MLTAKPFDPQGLFPHNPWMGHALQENSGKIGVGGYPLTDEQLAIIRQPPTETRQWQAFAGCTKTTTAVEYTHAWPNHRALYLAFNASIAAEAKGKFPPHVQTQTAHSHAYQVLNMSRFRDRIVPRLRPNDIDACQHLLRPIGNMKPDAINRAVIKTMNNFLISADHQVKERHVMGVPIQTRGSVLSMFSAVIDAFMDIERGDLPITHDMYLKYFSLHRRISKEFDYLLVDEAQDLNPVLIDIVRRSELPAMIIGDPWQSIYAFRGAEQAMARMPGEVLPLSKSFRFGPDVAKVANEVLKRSLEKPTRPLRGNEEKKSVVQEYTGKLERRTTVLARTNFRLFEGLCSITVPFHVVGGIEEMTNQVEAGYALFKRRRPRVIDPLVSRFRTWEDCKDAAEYDDEPELTRLVKIIEQYTDSIPEILAGMRKLHTPNEDQARLVVSTAHKAKGREWPHVVVMDDFVSPTQLMAMLAKKKITAREYQQEVNLIYVTLTRAIETLSISDPLFEDIAVPAGVVVDL
ncbi:ATP-dependent helicase (plasmid) [Erythrobacter aureus]|uniref:ATP-dependent helicase n=2 Tax=Erythrobacter aureus TaxID=2182384 RepID=A0A345YJJ4_9SPHN|nr:ATP-dependent helicase [Erythrobacter aureus]